MRIQYIVLLLLASTPFHSRAYDLQRSMDNLAEDVSACVAFYTIVTVDARRNAVQDAKWGEVAAKFEATLQSALDLLRLVMTGRSENFVQSKIDLRMQGSLKTLQSEGIDRLMFLHADSCKSLMENPDTRLEYWKQRQ